jgi:thiopeptide-type bacteriocin biosynthesis protein
MFTRSDDRIVLDSTGGASALSLLGRFSVFTPEIATLCRQIAAEEQAANPEVVFAEIHQLSDNHVDNVNRRVPLYPAVIDINTFPQAEGPQQELALSDLTVRLQGEELWLESVSLGKRVIPRLPTAYNFHHNGLAIFQMLCDLQFEGLQVNLTLDLEKLFPGLDFYPRVTYRNVILCAAKWRIAAAATTALAAKPASIGRLHQFRQERGIPAQVTMGLSDRQLSFNLVNDEEALFFLDCLGGGSAITLREYLPPAGQVTDGKQNFNGQFIGIIKNGSNVYRNIVQPMEKTPAVQRRFLPGSEWLYLKIYCTPESADRLLDKVIAPFLKKHQALISSWFFIRYQDPDPHIRLRLKSSPESSGVLLTALTGKLAKLRPGPVRDVRCDTYEREIERYSAALIILAEGYFHQGSEWTLKQLRSAPQENSTAPFALSYLLAERFLCRPETVALFFEWRAAGFLAELSADKKLKVSFDSKYRKLSAGLKRNLAAPPDAGNLLASLSAVALGAANWPEERRFTLLADLLHMQVNRMFAAEQRRHEALICYCLAKYAKSVLLSD